jgi:hypothetical protein
LETDSTRPNLVDSWIVAKILHIDNKVPLEESLSSSRLASVKSCWKRHGASSDVQNSKILELSGGLLKAKSLFVRIDTVFQS